MAIATVLMIIGLILSKGSGFLRDIFVSIRFQSAEYRDAFTLAFVIPDFFFSLLVGGSIQAAITPSLSRAIERKEEKKGWRSISIFITLMAIIMFCVVLIGVIFATPLYSLVNPDTDSEIVRMASNMSRALFPQIFFMMLAALLIGILNAYKKFSSTAFGPTVYNICVLLAIILLGATSEDALYLTGVGILGAAIVYFLFQLVMARKEIRNFRPNFAFKDPGFRKLLRLALPILISASIVQLNMLVLNSFAGGFSEGSIYALRQASTLWQLPYGIFAVAVGNVMLPNLAAFAAARDTKGASRLLSSSLKNALFMTIPSAGLLFMLRYDVVMGLYSWSSAYTPENGRAVATFLAGYCLAIITHTVIFIMNQAFYAVGETKIPLFAGLVTLISNFAFCMFFINAGMGPISLTIAYSSTSVITMTILCFIYSKNKALRPRGMIVFLMKSLVCLLSMIVVLLLIDFIPFEPSTKITSLLWLFVRAGIGIVTYFMTAWILKMHELRVALDKVVSRLLRRKNHT